MTGITTYLSIIMLNINSLNSLIKTHRLVGWIKKQDLRLRGMAQQVDICLASSRPEFKPKYHQKKFGLGNWAQTHNPGYSGNDWEDRSLWSVWAKS
jgi:hypothetical protein